jgi:hypothetical protein|tara:strand:- start:411 stop:734 length:324 start_codon:yes stop_codon:yes gene_type:complete
MISKISKEKQIFLESFDRRNLNRNNTKNIMDRMFQVKKNQIRKSREEEYENKVREWSKQKSFDMNLINQKLSPTSKSPSRSFISLQEQREREFWIELDEILESLEKD